MAEIEKKVDADRAVIDAKAAADAAAKAADDATKAAADATAKAAADATAKAAAEAAAADANTKTVGSRNVQRRLLRIREATKLRFARADQVEVPFQGSSAAPGPSSDPKPSRGSVSSTRIESRMAQLQQKLTAPAVEKKKASTFGPPATTWQEKVRVEAKSVPAANVDKAISEKIEEVQLWRFQIEQNLADAIKGIDSAKARATASGKNLRVVLPAATANCALVAKKGGATSSGSTTKAADDCKVDSAAVAGLFQNFGKGTGVASVLNTLLSAQPSLANTFQKLASKGVGNFTKEIGLTDADLSTLGSFANDINTQANAANHRLEAMVQEIFQIGTDLDEEGLGHTQAIATVANMEVKRWILLGTLDRNYDEVFDSDTSFVTLLPETYPLFAATSDINGWVPPKADLARTSPDGKPPANAKATPPFTEELSHPPIAPDDRIYSSVIQLLQTARAWHGVLLRPGDGDYADQLDIADRRLYLAVRTVQGHMLMSAMNQKMADENTIRITHELALHENQLDDFLARVEEANLRLSLGNVKAYYETGVTSSDVQAIVGILNDVYLSLTVSKVFK